MLSCLCSLLFVALFFLVELLYFRFANHFNIVDKPNHRSSHSNETIRGGGIIFPLAALSYYPISGFNSTYLWFYLGLSLIALVSFIDDLKPISNRIRLFVHFLSVTLLFYDVEFLNYSLWLILFGYILVIGIINAYNFMDGINGITGLYSLSFILTIVWLNKSYQLVNQDLLLLLLAAITVFLFFNFRTKARCFAGDVGSVSLAFIICFLLLLLIKTSHNLAYIGFLTVYGLDAVSTIVFRLIRRENIFEAHRSHFYQFLVNERKIAALKVSSAYALAQLGINILLIVSCQDSLDDHLISLICTLFALLGGFMWMRLLVEGKERLCVAKDIA